MEGWMNLYDAGVVKRSSKKCPGLWGVFGSLELYDFVWGYYEVLKEFLWKCFRELYAWVFHKLAFGLDLWSLLTDCDFCRNFPYLKTTLMLQVVFGDKADMGSLRCELAYPISSQEYHVWVDGVSSKNPTNGIWNRSQGQFTELQFQWFNAAVLGAF